MKLTPAQKRAGIFEFAIGVPANILLALALYFWLLPDYTGMESAVNRVLFALQCNALPASVMLIILGAVALSRGTSRALDPLLGAESRTLQIHIRVLSNTTEQLLLFFVSSVALSTFLTAETVRIIPTAAILFFVNRFVFWFGYLKDPLLRGAGLSGTLYPIAFMVFYSAYLAANLILFGKP